jgi:hypothetical protein
LPEAYWKLIFSSELKIIEISDPEDTELIYSSEKMIGRRLFGTGFIAIKDDYAYVLAVTGKGESGYTFYTRWL